MIEILIRPAVRLGIWAYQSGKGGTILTTTAAIMGGAGILLFVVTDIDETVKSCCSNEQYYQLLNIGIGGALYAASLGLLYAMPKMVNQQSLLFKPCTALIMGTVASLGAIFFAFNTCSAINEHKPFGIVIGESLASSLAIAIALAMVAIPTVVRC